MSDTTMTSAAMAMSPLGARITNRGYKAGNWMGAQCAQCFIPDQIDLAHPYGPTPTTYSYLTSQPAVVCYPSRHCFSTWRLTRRDIPETYAFQQTFEMLDLPGLAYTFGELPVITYHHALNPQVQYDYGDIYQFSGGSWFLARGLWRFEIDFFVNEGAGFEPGNPFLIHLYAAPHRVHTGSVIMQEIASFSPTQGGNHFIYEKWLQVAPFWNIFLGTSGFIFDPSAIGDIFLDSVIHATRMAPLLPPP